MSYKEKDRYTQLIGKLKTHPVLDNPDELTDDIIRQINALPAGRKPVKLRIYGWISGAVAITLLCLLPFGWQQAGKNVQRDNDISSVFTYEVYEKSDATANLEEKKKLAQSIVSERQKSRTKKSALYTYILKISSTNEN